MASPSTSGGCRSGPGAALAEASIRYAGGELPLRAARTVAVGIRPDQHLTVTVRAPREVEGPIRRGATLGTATVFVDGLRAASVPLRAGRAVPRQARSIGRAASSVTICSGLHLPLSVILIAGALLLEAPISR